ncbi:MAG: ParB/RepB/Spo0J family partition protein [Deltaproteobacteria bacterium]|nr:ParB/RepB/Spo0J family partition protein [Deltaproteobacteria bacterium]
MNYQEIELTRITPNPHNPRERFEGVKFDELVKSIKEKGVIQPIVVRPTGECFELVAGERRFTALKKVSESNGGIENHKIPAIVRELTDDEAFDLMTIENLQREDLTELEEARSFKAYLDRKGEESIADLSERTGIKQQYIRRRVSVLSLPDKILKSWSSGKVTYGHLEQLCRLKGKDIMGFYQSLFQYTDGTAQPVKWLRERIDNISPSLKAAMFSTDECDKCNMNSTVQKSLFGYDMEKARCQDPKCFKQRQNNWLIKNWKKTKYRKRFGTNGFRFYEDTGYQFESFWSSKPKQCSDCEKFVTIIDLSGDIHRERACVGKDPACFNKATRPEPEKKVKGEEKTGPRVAWHGEHFRERFLEEQLPVRFQEIGHDDVKAARFSLMALLDSNSDLHGWFAVGHNIRDAKEKAEKSPEELSWFRISPEEVAEIIFKMDIEDVRKELKEASLMVIRQSRFGARGRMLVAEHVGVDIKKEWAITEEYLNKKTIKEMLKMGEDLEIFKDKKAQTFLYETLLKKRGSFQSCKKAELKRVFLESGVDLKGKVPEEILNY